MKKKWGYWLKVSLLFVAFLALCIFASQRYKLRTVKGVSFAIDYVQGNRFVSPSIAKEIWSNAGLSIDVRRLSSLSIADLEKALHEDPFVKKAEVYADRDGQIQVQITQELPVLRVKQGKTAYYLLEDGKRVNVSTRYSAKVPLVEGDIQPDEYKPLVSLVNEIQQDNTLRQQVLGIVKKKSDRFILLIEGKNYIVSLGSLERTKEKLENYKVFYTKYAKHRTELPYKKIELKFKNQVVASR